MSILIKGMETPCEEAEPLRIELYADGTVIVIKEQDDFYEFKAVPVPAHGRLIDKDALEADISASVVFSGRDGNAEIVGAKKIINRLHIAPTIIPAECLVDHNKTLGEDKT